MKKLLLKIQQPWGMLRLIRLALAIILLAEAFQSAIWWLLVPGAFFLYQAMINAGCSTCPVPPHTRPTEDHNEEYEEIKKG